MAGYIGTKAVLLSTTAASVTGNADIGGDLTVDTSTLFVDSTNNRVGIETTSPDGKLDIALGSMDIVAGLGGNFPMWTYRNGSGSWFHAGKHPTDDAFIVATGATPTSTERMRIDSIGRVGIGTSSPAQKLDVRGGTEVNAQIYADSASANRSDLRLRINNTVGDSLITFGNSSTFDVGRIQYAYAGNTMGFFTNSSERMRIDASGNLLVRMTSNPDLGVLVVNQDASTNNVGISTVTSSTATRYHLLFRNGNGQVGGISTNGSSTFFNTSSDYRLKEDVQPMVGASDRVLALTPVNFAWKADGTRVDGFIAHEAQAVVPEAVTGTKDAMRTEEYEVTPAVEATYDEDGNELTPYVPAVMGTREVPDYQGIDQSKLVPLLTAALQEALTEIAALKDRVAALEAV